MSKEIDMKDYQKPELVYIDDPAFDETGKGDSGFNYGGGNPPRGPEGNPNFPPKGRTKHKH